MLVTLFGMGFPVYWLVQASFTAPQGAFQFPGSLFPLRPELGGYREMLPAMGPALGNSAIIAGGTTLLTLLVSVPTGYGLTLARHKASGSLVRLLVLVALAFPVVMFTIPLYEYFYHLHLLNSYLGLMLADSLYSVPLGTLVIYTYMCTLPVAISQAAMADGATHLRILRSIVAPLSAPALATTAIFSFLAAWGDYLFAATLTNGGGISPASTTLYSVGGGPSALAGGVILATPAIIAVVFAQRYIRAGLSAGALAG